MKKILSIGLIIADEMEYAAYEELMGDGLCQNNFYGRKGHRAVLEKGNKMIIINSILCGIGTVNAAVAAMHLVNNGCEILLNYGLSGGISGVHRGEDVVGASFIEYDFDLECCGYKKCEKPSQRYIYLSNREITEMLSKQGGGLKFVNVASGDKFVSDPVLRDTLKKEFDINACDMETAAIAYVAYLTGKPFACLRRISDDAGDDATDSYHDMNNKPMTDLPKLLLEVINLLFGKTYFWKK